MTRHRYERILCPKDGQPLSAHQLQSVGTELLGYRIEAQIGQGGMGVVYRAYDLRLKRRVALKLMAPELALDERFRDRFTRETELAMALEHPNVIPVHDAGEVDGRLYIAMRHVEGTDLRALLRAEGALAPDRAIAICRQVAGALDAAHARGLVHRDVKPSNVLLDEREHAYLADFGLTRQLADPSGELPGAHSLGTPAYLAPEQIEGGPVDHRADVYSLGCFLFECLTGEAPFARDARLAVIWAHLEEEPPAASECDPRLPAALDEVIRKALAKEPDARYSTCSELVAAAEQALGFRGRKAGRLTVIAAALVLVALATLGAALFVRGDGEAAASALAAWENTLVRIDPKTNAVAGVIDVGRAPVATAVGGRSVWVYNRADGTLSEIDAAAGEIRRTTRMETTWLSTDATLGPWLAADPGGAWFVGFDYDRVRFRLTRIRRGGQGIREYRLAGEPRAVAVAEGSAWVLVRTPRGNSVLRIQPQTGSVTARIRLPAESPGRVEALAVGDGAVWATEASGRGSAILHRVDISTGTSRSRDLGSWSTVPAVGFGWGWICSDFRMLRIHPHTLRSTLSRNALPAENGVFALGYTALWRHDVPSGALMRFDAATGDPSGIIPVITKSVEQRGLTVTSIAAGAGSVWATVAKDES